MQFRKAKLVWSQMSPIRKSCLKSSTQKATDGMKYQCNSCKKWFAYSDIQVDHVEAIGKTSPRNLQEYIKHFILLNSDSLQILCKSICHNKKTKEDIIKIKEKK